jgi:hypothetical protein
MATRRTTSDKRQREREKQQKAAAKRARRQERGDADDTPAVDAGPVDDEPTQELLLRMETLHANYDAGTLTFEEFEDQKSELLDRIAIRLAQ